MNTENKKWWVVHGKELEKVFIRDIAPNVGLVAQMNPEKEINRYAPDLIVNGRLSELKCCMTPFYTASKRISAWGKPSDPMTTVTFDRKDYLRYKEHYPNVDIYFWVSWADGEYKTVKGETIKVRSLEGVWRIPFSRLSKLIEMGRYPLHEYLHRKDDMDGNSKECYLVDLRDLKHIVSNR